MTGGRRLVGVDLGGTLIRAALATANVGHGTPVVHPTPSGQGPGAVLDAIAGAVREACGSDLPDGVAVGIPGPLDPRRGVVYAAPNLTGWSNVPAVDMLVERLGCPVVIRNDAQVAGFAEYVAGAGRGTLEMAFITVSTGVGGALVINGELHGGMAGTAGEIGHTLAVADGPSCSQGHPGCLEGSASGTAIARRAREAIAAGERTSLRNLPAGTAVDAKAVVAAAREGDALSVRLLAHAGRVLGLAVGGLVNLLSPQMVVIGGGLINAGPLLFDPMREALPEIAFDVPLSTCKVVPAALGTDAGLVGACAWAVRRLGRAEA